MSPRSLTGQLSDAGWAERLREDRDRAERFQTPDQQAITSAVMSRAIELGASAFALTGSTARNHRTAISDLDYHVVGRRPDVSDLPGDVDVIATSAPRFRHRLVEGDDFVQWTLRCGCILYDTGPMREGVRQIVEMELWPNAQSKLDSLDMHRGEVRRLMMMSDQSAAQEQLRAMFTTAARGLLLDASVFPLARKELPGQLERAGHTPLAEVLRRAIHATMQLDEIEAGLKVLDATIESSRTPLPA
ncbi:MAG: hypothetical protein ACYDHN_10225 [Solirubrobacteraceae bacterium]